MGTFKHLPKDNPAQHIQDAAETALEDFIKKNKTLFSINRIDHNDYGSDYQLEAKDNGYRTNLRSHIQLKGSTAALNKDGSISIDIEGSNLKYLIHQPRSLYICFSLKQKKLFVRPADDIYRQCNKEKGSTWQAQKTIAVRFSHELDAEFLKKFHRIMIDTGRGESSQRLEWAASPPENLSKILRAPPRTIEVPSDPAEAFARLEEMYKAGEDLIISNAFDQFRSVVGENPTALGYLFMSEINLGLNRHPFQESRIREGITHFKKILSDRRTAKGSTHYCLGNCYLALKKHRLAISHYKQAEKLLAKPQYRLIASQTMKNLGSAYGALGYHKKSKEAYESALHLDPDLGEAHFALAHWHRNNGNDLHKALVHLDAVSLSRGSALSMAAIDGWRAEFSFLLGDYATAFRAINSLTGKRDSHAYGWEWGSSARQVAEHGRKSTAATRLAYPFWRRFLEHHPNESAAMSEEFLCAWDLHHEKENIALTFDEFLRLGLHLAQLHVLDEAFILDKVGHWAQDDGDWELAAHWFNKAYEKNKAIYGACLGEALNHLGRYTDALPILRHHVKKHKSDAVAWFKLGFTCDKLGMSTDAIKAFGKAVELDITYEAAWFNLGGMIWNAGYTMEGLYVWSQATRLFPDSSLTKKILRQFPVLATTQPNADSPPVAPKKLRL